MSMMQFNSCAKNRDREAHTHHHEQKSLMKQTVSGQGKVQFYS
jgi:hypothetical protein